MIIQEELVGATGELLGHNMFAYCKNNVVNAYDPSGFREVFCEAGEVETDEMYEDSISDMNQRYKESQEAITYSKMNDLGKGWSYRHDKGGSHTREKDHVHVQGGGKKYQQDIDGGRRTLENPPGLPDPPSKVRQRLKEKEGWDWDANAAKPTASKVMTVVSLAGGGYFVYRAARMIPSLSPPLWWTIPGNLAVP